jgi:hypothetical protein
MDAVTRYVVEETEKRAGGLVRKAVIGIERHHGVTLSIHVQQDPTLTKDGFPASLAPGVAVSVPPAVSEPHKIAAKADAAVEAIIERLTVALKQVDI